VLRRVSSAVAVPILVVVSGVWGSYLTRHGSRLLLGAPPFFGHYAVRVDVGTPLAVLVGLAVVLRGPDLAQRLSWRWLPWVSVAVASAWAFSLALVDGPGGVRRPLTTSDEYLHDLPRVQDVTGFLSRFVAHINTHGGPDAWTTHVAGHPPGMLLLLAGLREIGLSGPWPAAVFCVLVGSSAAAAVLVTVRNVVDEVAARAAAPYLVLLPAAVWVAVSADAVFLGVSAWGIAVLSGAGLKRAALGGLLLGCALMLTYGVVTLGLVPLSVLLVRRTLLPVVVAGAATALVLAVFAALGFNWFDGLSETLIRYHAGAGGYRPLSYFVVTDLVVFAAAVGPAVAAGLWTLDRRDRLSWLVGAALIGILLADASGKAKAEVERIWLMFTPWVALAAVRLDRPRLWLGVQAAAGLTIQTVLVSKW
jgi:hypothetical protein